MTGRYHTPRCVWCRVVQPHAIMVHISSRIHYCQSCWEKKLKKDAEKWKRNNEGNLRP
jgi:hypothetical protein